MASVIDSLVLELGLDTSGMAQGRKDVEDIFKKLRDGSTDTGKKIEESAQHVTESITKLKNGLLNLLVVFTAGKGIQEFISHITETDVALGKLSRSTETATSTISELEGAAAASGGTASGMAATIQGLQSSFQQFAITGQGATIPYLRALGIQLNHNKDGAVNVTDELMQMASAAQRMGGGARAAEMLRGAGIGDEGTLNLLLQGPEAVQRYRAAIDAAGNATAKDVAAANARNQSLVIFDRAITTLGRNILTFLTPVLTGLVNLITNVAESPIGQGVLTVVFIALSAAVGLLSLSLTALAASTAWAGLVSGFGLLSGAIMFVATVAIPAIIDAFVLFGTILLATPLGWIIAAIAALGVAGYELIEHWSAVKSFFQSLWDDIAGYFQAGADKISKIPVVRWVFRKLGIGAPGAEGGPSAPKPSPSGAGTSSKPSGARSTSASDKAINSVLRHEDSTLSGKVTSDSGGTTKYGISSNAHPGLDVANLSLDDAKKIYKTEYWDPIGGDSLPAALQGTALDAAINQGVGNAKAWLKASGGDANKFNALRRGQYEHLAQSNPEKYSKYLKGWESRVPSATQTALSTAGAGAAFASLPTVGASSAAFAANPSSTVTTTTSTTDVNFAGITINTRATDAKGIAAAIKPQLRLAALAASSQSGPR